MNSFSQILAEGDLRSDGFADEVARIVAENPALLPDLLAALTSPNPSVRGHAADALEKASRSHPHRVAPYLPHIISAARNDHVPMIAIVDEVWRCRVRDVFLGTFGFQAPALYQQHGYRVFGELPEFPTGHQRYFLTSVLKGMSRDTQITTISVFS